MWRTPATGCGPPAGRHTSTSDVDAIGDHVDHLRFALEPALDVQQRMAAHGPAEARPGVRPEGHVDHAGLVLERQEDGAAGGHRVLASDHQPADPDPARAGIAQRARGGDMQPIKGGPEKLDHLAPCIERQDRVGIAQALQLGRRRKVGRIGRRQAQVESLRLPRGRPGAGLACRPGDFAQLPQQLDAGARPASRARRHG